VRELLYKERLKNVEDKIEEVRSGKAKEYLNPLEQLQENMRIRIEVAGKLRDFRTVNLKNKFEAEELASFQNFESEKALLFDSIKNDLEEKIQRLEEDRNNDFTSELWLESALKRKNKKSIDIFGEKRKKAVTVSGPYVVYMLNDVDIVEDWTIIKKALAAPKRKFIDIGSF
jgi:breast cancer metastasis-suppressor 1-like protein